jgi:hypothetical protein
MLPPLLSLSALPEGATLPAAGATIRAVTPAW